MKKLLSFTGGGVRGCFSSTLVERLDLKLNEIFAFSGTSTGAIVASLLALGYKPSEVTKFFLTYAQDIFYRPWYKPKFLNSPYNIEVLQNIFKKEVGSVTLGDLKQKIIISTYDLDGSFRGVRSSKAKFFHNFDVLNNKKDIPIWYAVSCSCAAVSYFSPVDNRYTDGGFIENHGGLPLLFQCLHHAGGVDATVDSLSLLSIGTGSVPSFIDSTIPKKWHVFNNLKVAIDSIAAANVTVSDYGLTAILGDKYLRVDKPLKNSVELDNWEAIPDVIEEAKLVDLAAARAWLDQYQY